MNRADCDGYSLVLHAFQGKFKDFQEAATKEFGKRGFSAFSFFWDDKNLPAEIAASLDKETARRIATGLEATGASVVVVPSYEVTGVRWHAQECWPDRVVRGWSFTEVEDMILTLSPLNARENVPKVRAIYPKWAPWQIECSLNHQHPTCEFSRHGLRSAREVGTDLTQALREAYPERGFVIEYYDEEISFYQRGENVPETSEPPAYPLPEMIRCETCNGQKAYRLRDQADAEFPLADWGECVACGKELLLRTGKILAPIG